MYLNIFLLLFFISITNARVKYALRENKLALDYTHQDCYIKGGHCVDSESQCFNGIRDWSACGNSTKQICCLPKPKEKCFIERCDGLIQDCTQDNEFMRFNPLVCMVYKRCLITNQTYHQSCPTSPSLQIVCCAEESKIVKSLNEFQTLVISPNGTREGILFDTRYEEYEMQRVRRGQIPLILAVIFTMIGIFLILILVFVKTKGYLKKIGSHQLDSIGDRTRY